VIKSRSAALVKLRSSATLTKDISCTMSIAWLLAAKRLA
jgi:hypothetical protein